MKTKTTLSLIGLFLAGNAISQVTTATLNENNCSAIVSDIGIFFNDPANSMAGYEVPAGSGTKSLYTASMWFGGLDVNGQLKMAIPTYYPGQDMWPGSITIGSAEAIVPNPLGQTLWIVSKAQIEDHINNFQSPGYVIPGDILNWPAHGNTAQGQAYFLAPYIDLTGNGIYEPADGDYPCIKGDKAVYTIVNDSENVHASNSDPIGLEVHYMFYQFSSEPGLEEITFIDAHVINRGSQSLTDFTSTFFVDPDLGNYGDDFMGSDSTRNLMYAYNSDNFDESNGGNLGYGSNPPAIGIVCLSNSVDKIGTFTNGVGQPFSDPSSPPQYYDIMRGNWTNGMDWTDNNGQATSFMYNGDPNNAAAWSEITALNPGGDRRMLMSVNGNGDVLPPFEEFDLSYAVVYGRGADYLASVDELFQVTDFVQNYYNSLNTSCPYASLGLSELEAESVGVYPNPSNGTFVLDSKDQEGIGTATLLDMSGRIIAEQALVFGGKVDFVTNASPGVYVIRVTSGRGDVALRVVIE